MKAPYIHLIVIKTDKPQDLVDFYSALGLTFDHHRHGNGPLHYSATAGSLVLEIYTLPKGVQHPDNTTRLGFTVDTLDAILLKLKGMGISIVSEPVVTEWGYSAVVQDPDGRKVELTQERDSQ